jgi:hypothetical protein
MICRTFSSAVPYSSASCRLRQGTVLRAAPDFDAGGGNRGRRGRWKDTRSRDRQWPIWGRRRLCQYTPGASRGRLLCLADARHLPLKVQAQAFVNGVIPYIPALGRDGTTRRLEAR